MNFEYKTEGKVLVPEDPAVDQGAMAITWLKGDNHAVLHKGKGSIELSQKQLRQLADIANRVAGDLGPDFAPEAA